MEKIKKISLLVVAILSLFGNAESQSMLDPNSLDGGKIQAAMLYWDYGSPEYLTIETIYPSQDSINHYWNVTHRSPHLNENSENGFDYYRINQKDLRPVISHMYHEGFTNYKILFDSDSALVDIRTPQDSVSYSLKLPNYIAPEGPGMPVFLASLPLKENYSIFYYELNRWSGENPKTGELQQTYLKVIGIETLTIEEKAYETYVLEITTEKGRYTKIWALKEAPHYWVKVDHKLNEDETISSKVIKLIIVKP